MCRKVPFYQYFFVTAVTIHNNENPGLNDSWIDLSLNYPAYSDLSNLAIQYIPPANGYITDLDIIPNKLDTFTIHRIPYSYFFDSYNIMDVEEPHVNDFEVSSDGKYMKIGLSSIIMSSDNHEFIIRVNGKEITDYIFVQMLNYSLFQVFDSEPTAKANTYTIEIIKNNGENINDVIGQEYNCVSGTINYPPDSSITPDEVYFDNANKLLGLTFTGGYRMPLNLQYACQYVITIDGIAYRLRGTADIKYTETGKFTLVFDEADMFDVDFSKINSNSNITFSLNTIMNNKKVSTGLIEASGKPIEDFELKLYIRE